MHKNATCIITIYDVMINISLLERRKCLILIPDSTSSQTFSQWRGLAEIVEVKHPNSYLVQLDDKQYHLHANFLRRYNVRVAEITCHDTDGQIMTVCQPNNISCNSCAAVLK